MKLRWHPLNSERGSAVAMAAVVAIAAAILIASASRNLLFFSHEVVYFNAMNRAYRLAESAMTNAVGRLTVDPKYYITDPLTNVCDGNDCYTVAISSSNKVVGSGYYVVTTASVTIAGRTYATRLHSHVRISNTGEYFWACANLLKLTPGINAAGGKVYAPQLEFLGPPTGTPTVVKRAEYRPAPYGSLTGYNAMDVQIVDAPFAPVALESDIVFPQVLDSDLKRYKKLARLEDAAPDHRECNFDRSPTFNGTNYLDVYPPGYADPPSGSDPYVATGFHTTDNSDHVYYCDGDMKIGYVRVHGQVLFVSTGAIWITGDIIRQSNDTATSSPDTQFPGFGSVNVASSTAHQAVLITPNNVFVSTNAYLLAQAPTGLRTLTIEAMILAPHRELSAIPYMNGANLNNVIHNNLSLIIRGAMILGAVRSTSPNNLPTVFADDRTYEYMDSLRTNPPPYLPALAEIYYSFEETFGAGSIF